MIFVVVTRPTDVDVQEAVTLWFWLKSPEFHADGICSLKIYCDMHKPSGWLYEKVGHCSLVL